MAWNASRPSDSDFIRLSAGLITDNFKALEAGTVPFDTISLESQTLFPALANHNRLYSYPSAGKIELLSANNAGDIVLLTEGGKLGSTTQNAIFASVQTGNVTFDGVYLYTGALMVTARGSISASGSVSQQVNLTCSHTVGTGIYKIRIPAGVLLVSSYQIIVTPFFASGSDTMVVNYNTKASVNPAAITEIIVETLRRSDGSHKDTAFEVVVIGGR